MGRFILSQNKRLRDSTFSTALSLLVWDVTKMPLVTTKYLLVLTSLKTHHLILSKETPVATLKILLSKTCIVYAVELLH